MGQWLIMKTPGIIKDPLFYLRILTVCTVLSTASLIFKTADNTSVENTFGKNESLDLRWTVKDQGELQVKVTGASTTVVVQSLRKILSGSGRLPLSERYSHSTLLLEK